MEDEETGVDFHSLPEGVISQIISFTSPRDACGSATVSSIFRSASDSDVVWERFLPPDYSEILSRTLSRVPFSTKKELFFRLVNRILIDSGRMSFSLEKSSGKKCFMLPARELTIIWGDTPTYWRWISLPESRFTDVAELLSVCWLEIRGRMDTKMLSPMSNYAAYLVLKFQPESFGFDFPPAELSVKLGGRETKHMGHLQANEHRRQRPLSVTSWPLAQALITRTHGRVPESRSDGWMEIELGQFFTNEGDEGDVEMSLLEVNGGSWKKGLVVEGIEVRPRE